MGRTGLETEVVPTMDSFTLTLAEEQARRLRERAREAGVSPEDLLRANVEAWLGRDPAGFSEAVAYVLEKNRELYRRLA